MGNCKRNSLWGAMRLFRQRLEITLQNAGYPASTYLTQPVSNTSTSTTTSTNPVSTGSGIGDSFQSSDIGGVVTSLLSVYSAWTQAGATNVDAQEQYVFTSPLAEMAIKRRVGADYSSLSEDKKNKISEEVDKYAISLSLQLDPETLKEELRSKLEEEGYDSETIEATLNEMFNGKSDGTGQPGISQKRDNGLSSPEELQLSLLNGYTKALTGIYNGNLTEDAAKARLEKFQSQAKARVQLYKTELEDQAKKNAAFKKNASDYKEAMFIASQELSTSADENDADGDGVAGILGADALYATTYVDPNSVSVT